MRGFIHELRRRSVFKVAAGYALVAWILIESGSVLLPTFGVPDWFFKVYVLIVFGGFVVAMIIAWVFEITPEGVRLESEIDRQSEPLPPRGGLNIGLIALLGIALVVSITLNFTGIGGTDGDDIEPASAKTWVAILPFENRSVDPENAFLTDGIHADLMDRLQQVGSLQVISRTSAKAYADTTKSMREIGEELDVSTIVEGSVQRSGDQVKVIVRVFDAATEERLWSDSFERDASLQSVFDLQSEISSRIVAALPISAAVDEPAPAIRSPTDDPMALAAYVAGVNHLDQREYGALEQARGEFERAIRLDPDYARAYAKLAETVMVLYTNHRAMSLDEAATVASEAVERALAIDPLLADAYAVRGLIEAQRWEARRIGDGNVSAAADFEKALAINPSLSMAYVWYSSLLETEDRVDEAIQKLRLAIDLDSRNRIPYVNMPGLLALKGRHDEAISLLLYTVELFPQWSLPNDYLARHLQGLGRIDEALAWSMRLRELSDDPLASANSLGLYRLLGHESQIDDFLRSIPESHPAIPLARAYERFIRADYAAVREILEPLERKEYANVPYFYRMLARAAVMQHDFRQARTWLLRQHPDIAGDVENPVNRYNASDAALLGFVELELGNPNRARELLENVLDVTRDLPREGYFGYGILDVRVLAQLGRHQDATDAFEAAVDDGFVSNLFFDFLEVDQDPLLDAIRDEPRYMAARDRMQDRLAGMAATIDAAIESGDWEAIRERTTSESSLVAERR